MPFSDSSRLKILFVCGRNQKRSPTAARVYQNDPRVEVRSGGVSESSRRRVNASDLGWADRVVVMERRHSARLAAQFPDARSEIVCLEIPDEYEFMDDELVDLLRQGVEPMLVEHSAE